VDHEGVTYLAFLAVFLLPPLLALALTATGRPSPARLGGALALVVVAALVWTTPWDNYLVWRGIWNYGPDRVVGRIGWVPVEEYLFFVLQPLLAGLWLARLDPSLPPRPVPEPRRLGPLPVAAVAWLAVAAAGVVLAVTGAATYLGLILLWAGPAIAFQQVAGARALATRRRLRLAVVAPVTAYLWCADAVAIAAGIWHISPAATVGFAPAGLPLEEAVFFLLTTLLVADGLVLYLEGRSGLEVTDLTDDIDKQEPASPDLAPEPVDAEVESARLLANEARPELGAEGYDNLRIDELADAFIARNIGQGLDEFLRWARIEGPIPSGEDRVL
jgi:lycopene cyclase domain-containing protein